MIKMQKQIKQEKIPELIDKYSTDGAKIILIEGKYLGWDKEKIKQTAERYERFVNLIVNETKDAKSGEQIIIDSLSMIWAVFRQEPIDLLALSFSKPIEKEFQEKLDCDTSAIFIKDILKKRNINADIGIIIAPKAEHAFLKIRDRDLYVETTYISNEKKEKEIMMMNKKAFDNLYKKEFGMNVKYIIDKNLSFVYSNIGAYLLKKGMKTYKFEKAEEVLKIAINLNQKNTAGLMNLANLYYLKEDYSKALSIYKKVKKIGAGETKVLILIAACELKNGKIKESVDIAKSVIEKTESKQEKKEIYPILITGLLNLGQIEKAEKYINQMKKFGETNILKTLERNLKQAKNKKRQKEK